MSELEERGGTHSGIVREELELLRLEKNTWGLLQAVLPYAFPCSVMQPLTTCAELERLPGSLDQALKPFFFKIHTHRLQR